MTPAALPRAVVVCNDSARPSGAEGKAGTAGVTFQGWDQHGIRVDLFNAPAHPRC